MSTTTMVYLVGFVLLALLVYTLLSERGDDDQAVDVEVEEEEAEDDNTDSTDGALITG